MQNWDYQTLSFTVDSGMFGNKEYQPQPLDIELNRLGKQGWELVSMVGIATAHGWTTQILATLKRPRS